MRIDVAFSYVQHAFNSGRLATGGLLIVGDTRGSGDKLATLILQMLFCNEIDKPCQNCTSCKQVADKTAFDAVWVEPEMRSRQISVEQVRNRLINTATQTSLLGGWKAGVVIQADRMTTQAANAFLKTLEEPPPQTIFLLLVESVQNLLPTIISRCQRIDVSDEGDKVPPPWRDELLQMVIKTNTATPVGAMALAAQVCALLGDLKRETEEAVKGEADADETGIEVSDSELDARIQSRYREARQQVLIELQCWYRDMLVLQSGGDKKLLHFAQHGDLLQERAQNLTMTQALENVQALDSIQRQLERNMTEANIFSYWFDRIKSGIKTPGGRHG